MNKLPDLFTNTFDKKIDNSQEYLKITNNEIKVNNSKYDINKKIDNIFKSSNFIYKKNVKITFNDKEENYIIIGRTKNNLITMDNKLISIDSILDIKEVE